MYSASRRAWVRFDPYGVELTSGFAAVAWGIYVLLAATPLADLPAYDPLTQFVPDEAWTVIASVCGVAQAAAALWGRRGGRMPAALGLTVWWKVLGVSLLNSGASGPAASIYFALALANAAAFVRLFR